MIEIQDLRFKTNTVKLLTLYQGLLLRNVQQNEKKPLLGPICDVSLPAGCLICGG